MKQILLLMIVSYTNIVFSQNYWKKIVKVNMHFLLTDSGTDNFTEVNDNDGDLYNGFDYAFDLIDFCNEFLKYNTQMNIPPGNNIPNLPINIQFIMDGIYFHRNSSFANNPDFYYNSFSKDMDNVINIFMTPSKNNGGYTYSNPFTIHKYVVNNGTYNRYIAYKYKTLDPNDQMSWVLHSIGFLITHEIFHTFGLLHTVLTNNGSPCAVSSCGDHCLDTPSFEEILQIYNSPYHPGDKTKCGWGNGSKPFCSNNLMEYSGQNSLTPCQIQTVHSNLENHMRAYLLCSSLSKDEYICNPSEFKTAFSGNEVIFKCAYIQNVKRLNIVYERAVSINDILDIRFDIKYMNSNDAYTDFISLIGCN